MSFTFDNTIATDLAKVRFEIGDTNEKGHYLEDETINYYLTDGVGSAVINCIEYIITQLSMPDFKLDWMSVSNAQARAGFETILKTKRQKYGIYNVSMVSTVSHAHRADSYENQDGVYTAPDGL